MFLFLGKFPRDTCSGTACRGQEASCRNGIVFHQRHSINDSNIDWSRTQHDKSGGDNFTSACLSRRARAWSRWWRFVIVQMRNLLFSLQKNSKDDLCFWSSASQNCKTSLSTTVSKNCSSIFSIFFIIFFLFEWIWTHWPLCNLDEWPPFSFYM